MSKRREGSIIQLGPGHFKVRWTETDASGKRRAPSRNIRGSRRDAERALRKLQTSKDEGTYVEPSKQTLGAYLEEWLKTVKSGLAPRTFRDYTRALNAYVLPRLGGRRLTAGDELVFSAATYRSQLDNRRACVERLRALVVEALKVPKERKPTRPSRGSVEKRLAEKRRVSGKKGTRRRPEPEE